MKQQEHMINRNTAVNSVMYSAILHIQDLLLLLIIILIIIMIIIKLFAKTYSLKTSVYNILWVR